MSEQIPKIIHYGWFGGKEKSKFIKKCIASWKKYLPDYEIREWNESNFDIQAHPFAREAYAAGKFAFVSDYLRAYVMTQVGGIYFDTDIEVRCDFTDKLAGASFVIAFERPDTLMTGFMAGVKDNILMKEFLAYYDSISFYDEKGNMRLTPNTDLLAELAGKFGFEHTGEYQELTGNIRIYPNEIFGGYNVYDMIYTITENTVLVHHYTASWRTFWEEIPVKSKKLFLKIFGVESFRFMRKIKHKILRK